MSRHCFRHKDRPNWLFIVIFLPYLDKEFPHLPFFCVEILLNYIPHIKSGGPTSADLPNTVDGVMEKKK